MKFLKTKRIRPTQKKLQKTVTGYKRLTAEITDEKAMDMLNTDKRNNFLMLLNVADHMKTGKSWAILTAFKLGYLQGKAVQGPCGHDMAFQNLLSEVVLKLEKASLVLRTTIDAHFLDVNHMDHDEITAIGANASNICDMIVIADDYLYYAQKELEGVLK